MVDHRMGLTPKRSLLPLRPSSLHQPHQPGAGEMGLPAHMKPPAALWPQVPLQESPGRHPNSTARIALCPQGPPPWAQKTFWNSKNI